MQPLQGINIPVLQFATKMLRTYKHGPTDPGLDSTFQRMCSDADRGMPSVTWLWSPAVQASEHPFWCQQWCASGETASGKHFHCPWAIQERCPGRAQMQKAQGSPMLLEHTPRSAYPTTAGCGPLLVLLPPRQPRRIGARAVLGPIGLLSHAPLLAVHRWMESERQTQMEHAIVEHVPVSGDLATLQIGEEEED